LAGTPMFTQQAVFAELFLQTQYINRPNALFIKTEKRLLQNIFAAAL